MGRLRVLGLDFGEKTIGMALSDPMGWTAQGHGTIRRRFDLEADLLELRKVIEAQGVEEIVLGLPRNLNGGEGPKAAATRDFAGILTERFGLPVHLWDERLSTVGAGRALLEADLSRQKRKRVIDQQAAVFILQGFLDRRRMKA